MSKLFYRPPMLAAYVIIVVTCALGKWQLDRGHLRDTRAAALAAAEAAPALVLGGAPPTLTDTRRVRARGIWLFAQTVLLANRPHGVAGGKQGEPLGRLDGRAGFEVLTPLQLRSGGIVMVKRGWLPRDPVDPARVPSFTTPPGEVEIEGTTLAGTGQVYALSGQPESGQRIRQNLDLTTYAAETGLALYPFVVEQTTDSGDGLSRHWIRPGTGADRNYGYAVQWFAMAVTAAIGAAYYLYRQRNTTR